jgi:hypothetical protein
MTTSSCWWTLPQARRQRAKRACGGGFSNMPERVVRAGDKGSHFGRFRPEPVVHPGEPPVDGDAVRTLQ